MAFAENSRYAHLKPYEVTDHRGRKVRVVPVPPPPRDVPLGIHLRTQGQRLDHLAFQYLKDAEAYWRICEINDVMLPEALGEVAEIVIPQRGRK